MKTLAILLVTIQRLAAQTSFSACDINHDGVVSVADAQWAINEALGVAPCTDDLNGDGQCTVVEVQRVITAALGGSCNTSPTTTQSNILITSPTVGQTISGYSFPFTVSTSGLTQQVQYLLDQRQLTVVSAAPFSYVWDSTYRRYNGSHKIQAVALDASGNVLSTSPEIVFVIDNSGGTQLMSVTPSTSVNSTWSGTVTLTVGGTGTGPYYLFIDGYNQGTVIPIDTTKWFNGSHYLYLVDTGPGGLGDLNRHTMWAQQVTFNNGASGNVEIRSNASFLPLTPANTFQLTCTLYKTDQSAATCSSPAWASSNPSAATVSAGGLVTATAPGDATITMTSGQLTATTWVSVNATINFPQFSKDGSLLTAYDPNRSIFPRSWWNFATVSNLTSYPGAVTDYLNGGANAFEDHPYLPPALSSSQSQEQWQALADGAINKITSFMDANPGLYLLARGDELGLGSGPPDGVYTTARPPWNGWNVNGFGPPAQYTTQRLVNHGRFLGWIGGDEVDNVVGRNASPIVWTPSTLGGQIVCTVGGSGNCHMDWGGTAPANFGLRRFNQLIITGSIHNPAINTPTGSTWAATGIDSNCSPTATITFTGPSVNDTWTAANDPSLSVTVMAQGWYNIAGIGPDYVRNDSIGAVVGQIHAAGGHFMWPESGAAIAYEGGLSPCQVSEAANYNNTPAIQDFSSMLWQYNHGPRWDAAAMLNQVVNDNAGGGAYRYFRTIFAAKNRNVPVLAEVQGTPVMYRIAGTPVLISSYSDGIFTFSQPHGVTVYKHGVTRMNVTGNSNPNLNTEFLVIAIPSPTTMQVALRASGRAQAGAAATGTAVFQDGTSTAVNGFSSQSGEGAGFVFANLNGPDSACANFKFGETFTVTGSNVANANGTWWYRNGSNLNIPCTGEQPTADDSRLVDTTDTGTGGTAYIITDNNYLPGRNYLIVSGTTPDTSLASLMAAVIYGAAGVRGYSFGNNEELWNGPTQSGVSLYFQNQPTGGDGVQPGAHPRFDYGGGKANWDALALGMNWIGTNEKYILQPPQVSPHYGAAIAASVRTGTYGAILMLLNVTETAQTRTIDLSPYVSSGSTTERDRITQYGVQSTTLGTTKDTVTLSPGEFIGYIMPNSNGVVNVSTPGKGFRSKTSLPKNAPAPAGSKRP